MFVLQISDDEKRAAAAWRAGLMIIALLLLGKAAAMLALTLHVCSAPKPLVKGFRIFGFRLVRDWTRAKACLTLLAPKHAYCAVLVAVR